MRENWLLSRSKYLFLFKTNILTFYILARVSWLVSTPDYKIQLWSYLSANLKQYFYRCCFIVDCFYECFCFFLPVCPTGQVRYGDNCYMLASASDTDILSSVDLCADKMSNLWSPEMSNEIAFITKTFPSAGSLYHLGIDQYVYGKGVLYSDNSFGVGVPFYTGNNNLELQLCEEIVAYLIWDIRILATRY